MAEPWRLEKSTLELIAALVLQSLIAVWYLSGLDHQVDTNTESIKKLLQRSDINGEWRQMQGIVNTKIQGLELQLAECKSIHLRIEDKLDRVLFGSQTRAGG